LSWPALVAWLGTLVIAFALPYEIYFIALPGWFIAVALFIALSAIQQKRDQRSADGRPR
jgi:cytosine permease